MDVDKPKFAKECRIGMKWKIKEEDAKKVQDHGYLVSRVFKARIPGIEYSLRMYPNGLDENGTNLVKIFLHFVFKKIKRMNSSFTISVKAASKIIKLQNEILYEDEVAVGHTLCTRDEVFDPEKQFFSDGIMEVELEGIIKADKGKSNALKHSSLGFLLRFCCEDEKDVTIVVGEEEIKVHKLVVCAFSPVLKAELNNSGFKDSIEKKIVISDFDFETVMFAVGHFYDANLEFCISDINNAELLRFADKYDIKSLHEYVEAAMINRLNDENVVEFANISFISNAHELREYCICFLVDASVNSRVVKDIEKLQDEIKNEYIQRSFLSFSE